MTPGSLAATCKVAGWDWIPSADRPLTWLLTQPFHLLPAGWIPVALNFFAAALAALTLGAVARSIELLLPNGRPEKTWLARLPVLLGVISCGLQLDFWREATAFSGEMLDVLLLATAGWCLLEHNVEKKRHWLDAAVLGWSTGMAENWVMLVTLPLFVGALIWLRGLRFFEKDFLLRTALLGAAGFAFFFLPALGHSLNPHSALGAGESWLAPLRSLKGTFHVLYYNFWSWHRLAVIGVLVYLLVPVLPCLMRMKNEDAPNLPPLDKMQVRMLRGLRFVLLLACVWLAFDPIVGPRAIVRSEMGIEMPLLTFDYLCALGTAFLASNLLFPIFIPPERRSRSRFEKARLLFQRYPLPLLLAPLLLVTIALLLLVTIALLARNWPAMVGGGRPTLELFGRTVAATLPAGGGIVLADDSIKLSLVQAALTRRADADNWLAANLQLLPNGRYRAALERKLPAGWQPGSGDISLDKVLQLLNHVARTNKIYFLQPHNGIFLFELFQPQPLGAAARLEPYPENHFERAAVSAATIAAGEKFWDTEWQLNLSALTPKHLRPAAGEVFFKHHFGLVPAQHDEAIFLRDWYSAALDDWGVVLQRQGKLLAAQTRFAQSLALNTNNFAAAVNAQVCSNLLAGKPVSLTSIGGLSKQFRNIQQLAQAVSACGELDHPGIRFLLGNACLTAGWPRQAWAEFDRAHELAADELPPQIALVQLYSRCNMHAEVFAGIKEMRRRLDHSTPAGLTLETELAVLEARSWFAQTNVLQGRQVLSDLAASHPHDVQVAETVFKAYLAFGDATNALALVEAQLAKNPDNISALNNRAALLIQTRRAAEALPVLHHALALTNLPSIRLNRAIAEMQLQDFAAAEKDYLLLTNAAVDPFSVHFGLAEIAENRRDTNAAIRQLEISLTNAPAGSLKWQQAGARLDALKNGS